MPSRSSALTTASPWKILPMDSTRESRSTHTWRKSRSQKSFGWSVVHVVERSSGHHLHWDFSWSNIVQRPRVHDTIRSLGSRRKRPRSQDEPSPLCRNRHGLCVALWDSPGGNFGRGTHLRRLDPEPLPGLRIRLRKVPIPVGEPWLQRDQEVSPSEGLGERIVLEGERSPEGHSRL